MLGRYGFSAEFPSGNPIENPYLPSIVNKNIPFLEKDEYQDHENIIVTKKIELI